MSLATPQHCPGPESLDAGFSEACRDCPSQDICTSRKSINVDDDPDVQQIRAKLKAIKHKFMVLSGKGGVGKTTFAALMGWFFAATNCQTEMLDLDFCGPSLAQIFGVQNERLHASASGWTPVYIEDDLGIMSIQFMLPESDDAVIWRGNKKNEMIKQFLLRSVWEDVDYLVIDTPPGTSDEHITINQYMKGTNLDGAILVTTPQEVALLDVRKEYDFCRKAGIRVLGIVENMSGFVCPSCHNSSEIFIATTGGGKALAEELGVPFLGSLPLDPRIGHCSDNGLNFVEQYPESAATTAIKNIIGHLDSIVTIS